MTDSWQITLWGLLTGTWFLEDSVVRSSLLLVPPLLAEAVPQLRAFRIVLKSPLFCWVLQSALQKKFPALSCA